MARSKPQSFQGCVVRRRLSKGSKSDREAVLLECEAGELVLRRRGGHPFGDRVLDALVGKQIRARGLVHGETLLLDAWEEQG